MKKIDNEFEMKNTPIQNDEFTKDDFKLVQSDSKIHEQKFQTKPTTFLKDSLKRFSKNKSSVVASVILGLLLTMSIFVPIIAKDKVHDSKTNTNLSWLAPRLFDPKLGLGFWDGTKKVENIPVDTSSDPEGKDPQANWWPAGYEKGAVVDGTKTFTKEAYTASATNFGKGGFVQIGYYNDLDPKEHEYVSYQTSSFVTDKSLFDLSYSHYLTVFDVYDAEKLSKTDEETKTFPENYVEAEAALYFNYKVYNPGVEQIDYDEVMILDYAKKFNIGVNEEKVNLNGKILEKLTKESLPSTTKFYDAYFEIRIKNNNAVHKNNACVLIKSISFETDAPYKEELESYNYEDGNKANIRRSSEKGYWIDLAPSVKKTYLSKAVLCSFRYDTYEASLGRMREIVDGLIIDRYVKDGLMTYSFKKDSSNKMVPGSWKCEILSDDCPIVEEIKEEDVLLTTFGKLKEANCTIMKYRKVLGEDKMPIFLLGTDKSGKDMLIYVFEGLRTSLLIGLVSSAICFLFGLFWGAICGYFGGNVDLVMERLTDILSGIPWIVVMTLVIINMGSSIFTFALALCLTGWIGTAATTRTQFYRFRGREYVLASRTLGASHARIITKHILPNAMGTIITSAVLMIPSVIFSEATISFLGLGFRNLPSLGVILSDNQAELTNNPYLLLFPAVIIALLMISFNLFGNGLRDAVNPSLKGEGE